MTIAFMVARGLELRREIATRQDELKIVEEQLKQAGLARPEAHLDLADAEREGRQWLAEGCEHTVPVIFTADYIMGSFPDKSPKHLVITTALGERAALLKQFFKVPKTWENKFDSGKKFRAHADDLLGKDAPAFITACLARDKDGVPKSAIKVEWDAAKGVAS